MGNCSTTQSWGCFLRRVLVLALLWAALAGTDGRSWMVGAPVVALAAWVGTRLSSAENWRLSWIGLSRFAVFFLAESLRGGFDVAGRAFRPRMRLNPGIVSYAMRLPAGVPRWIFCSTISLLPGTAVVEAEGDRISVHALDLTPEVRVELAALEARVAAMFRPVKPKAAGEQE